MAFAPEYPKPSRRKSTRWGQATPPYMPGPNPTPYDASRLPEKRRNAIGIPTPSVPPTDKPKPLSRNMQRLADTARLLSKSQMLANAKRRKRF